MGYSKAYSLYKVYITLHFSDLDAKVQLYELSVKIRPFVSCQLHFRLFVSCQLNGC